MDGIRSRGLLSARLADTPSDPEMLYGLRLHRPVVHRRCIRRAKPQAIVGLACGLASALPRLNYSRTMNPGLWLVRSKSHGTLVDRQVFWRSTFSPTISPKQRHRIGRSHGWIA